MSEAISQPSEPVAALKNGDPDHVFELVLSTKTTCNWAPSLLMNLARYYFSKGRTFLPYEVIPCGGPLVAGSDSKPSRA